METTDIKIQEEMAAAISGAPESMKEGSYFPYYSFDCYKVARAYIKEKGPKVKAAIMTLGFSRPVEERLFNAWRFKAVGLPFPDADRETAEALENLQDISILKAADPYLLYGEIYQDYKDYLAALRRLEALEKKTATEKWSSLQILLEEFSLYPPKARAYNRIFTQVALPLEVFNGVTSSNLNTFLTLCRRWAEIGEYFVAYRLALYALNMPVEDLNEAYPMPASLQGADNPTERAALQESLIKSAKVWAKSIDRKKDKTISIPRPFATILSGTIRGSRLENDKSMGTPLEAFAERFLKENPEFSPLTNLTEEEQAALQLAKEKAPESRTEQERQLLARKDNEAVNAKTLAKTLEAIVLLYNYKPAYTERSSRVIETTPNELARRAYPDTVDASPSQKNSLMVALRILDGMFILSSTSNEGLHFQRCITVEGFDTDKKGDIQRLTIRVYKNLLSGSPYLIDERTYYQMGRVLREGKRGCAGRFKFMIIGKTHIRESSALELLFGYNTELELAQRADGGEKGQNYRNTQEYIRKHKADDKKKLAGYFVTYKKKGLIAEYSYYTNIDGEQVYSWEVNKENGIYTELAR